MIGYEMSKFSSRKRASIYALFSPEGKKRIVALLKSELQVMSRFVLSYPTPELRKLERKVEKGIATDDEKLILSKNNKEFEGALVGGGLITEPKAIEIIKKHLKAIPLIESDLAKLGTGTEDASKANVDIVLGHPISYWNLNPYAIVPEAFEQMFDAPEFVRDELEKLIRPLILNGVTLERKPVFKDKLEVEDILITLKLEDYYERLLILLRSIRPLDAQEAPQYKAQLLEIINHLIESDKDFDLETYNLVSEYLPHYNNQKLRYFITLLHQNNDVGDVLVSSRISLLTLYAIYRKVDELCS